MRVTEDAEGDWNAMEEVGTYLSSGPVAKVGYDLYSTPTRRHG